MRGGAWRPGLAALVIAACALLPGHLAGNEILAPWASFALSPGARAFQGWLRCRMAEIAGGRACPSSSGGAFPAFSGQVGIFVTITRGRSARGCCGAFDHRDAGFETLAAEYLRCAMLHDPRHDPVGPLEAEGLALIVTVADRPFTVQDLRQVDLSIHGVVITTSDGGRVVFVPAEMITLEGMLARMNRDAITQVHAFRAVTIR